MSFQKIIFFPISILFFATTHAQLPYTTAVFSFTKDSAQTFGTSINYCGFPYQLKMNIYKPVGDNNPKRPMIIFVHGGAFISSADFNESEMNAMAIEFAKRGYVAASMDYREGVHLAAFGTGLPQTIGLWNLPGAVIDWRNEARLFAQDSAEIVRAVYRAQQDVKAAIRFLKGRATIDSGDICKFFLSGHSAGAISVLTTAFMDQPSEKPVLAGNNSNLANPNWLNNCIITNPFNPFECLLTQPNGPENKDDSAYAANNNPGDNFEYAASYLRPDLGPVDGDVNLNGNNAKILGVAGMAGAIVDSTLLDGPNKPAVFLYHQPADLVVSFGSSRPFSFYNDLLYPGPNTNWPVFFGSNFIKNKLDAMNYPSPVRTWWFDNSINDPFNTTTHSILPGIGILADTITKFFAQVIDTSNGCFAVIPVGASLSAEKNIKNVLLKIKLFENPPINTTAIIEHSMNGKDFFSLANVPLTNRMDYTINDLNPSVNNYYRVKITTANRTVKYSNIVQVRFSAHGNELLFYPNPVTNSTLIVAYYHDATSMKAQLQIRDMAGKLVHSTMISLQKGNNIIPVSLNNFEAGIYYGTIIPENGIKPASKKIIRL